MSREAAAEGRRSKAHGDFRSRRQYQLLSAFFPSHVTQMALHTVSNDLCMTRREQRTAVVEEMGSGVIFPQFKLLTV